MVANGIATGGGGISARGLRASAGLIAVFALLEVGALPALLAQWVSDLLQLALAVAAALLCARRSLASGGRPRALWAFLAASCLIWSIGQGLWTLGAEAIEGAPGPTPSSAFFLFSTAPLLLAYAVRPDRPERNAFWLAFDLGLLVVLALHAYVYFGLPFLLSSEPGSGRAWRIWYLVLDSTDTVIVLVATLWLLAGSRPPWRALYERLAWAVFVLHAGSTFSTSAVVSLSYHPGLLDVPWSLPFLWIGLAAIEWRPDAGFREALPASVDPDWRATRRGTRLATIAVMLVPAAHLANRVLWGQQDELTRLRDGLTLITTTAVGVLFMLRQLGILKQVERAERQRAERLRLLFQVNPMAMWVHEATSGRFLEVNEAALQLYGYRREEFLSLNLNDVLVPADMPTMPPGISEGLRLSERSHRTRDGRWIEVEVASHELALGSREGVLMVVADVTRRRVAERERAGLQAAVARSAAAWERTFDAIDSPVLIADRRLRITRANRAARELAAPAVADPVGQGLDALGGGEPWQAATRVARQILLSGEGVVVSGRDSEAGRSWEVEGSPLDEAGEDRLILVAREITGLVRLQETLRRQELTAAMGSLVAGVAHEVRNPLFGISANLDAFEKRFGEREEYRSFSRKIRNQLDRLSNLMQELLEYGRPPAVALSPHPAVEVVKEAVELCRPLAVQGGIRIRTRLKAGTGQVAMNRGRLVLVFRNLIENAIQHTEGHVTVEAAAADGWFECRVLDSGPGFAPEDLPHVFDPFFSRRQGGTGIGLSIVQRVVDEHGGQVDVDNRKGGGALVRVRLPFADVPVSG